MHEGKKIEVADNSGEQPADTIAGADTTANGDAGLDKGGNSVDKPKFETDLMLEELVLAEAEPPTIATQTATPPAIKEEHANQQEAEGVESTDHSLVSPDPEHISDQQNIPEPGPIEEDSEPVRDEPEPIPDEPEPVTDEPETNSDEPILKGSIESADEEKSSLAKRLAESIQARSDRNRLITLIVSILAALMVFGGGSFALYYWYQNPQKVVNDALVYMIKAKSVQGTGTINIKSTSADYAIAFSSQFDQGSIHQTAIVNIKPKGEGVENIGIMTVDGEVIYDSLDENIYLRLSGLGPVYRELIDNYIEARAAEATADGEVILDSGIAESKQRMNSFYSPLIKKLEDQWIKIPSSQIEDAVSPGGDDTCSIDTLREAFRDQETIDVYQKHQFIKIKDDLGSAGDSVGYLLGFDKSEAGAFADAVSHTDLGRSLKSCGAYTEYDSTDNVVSSDSIELELWADRWSHVPSRLVLAGPGGENDFNMDIKTAFETDVDVQAPADAKSLEEIQADIESLIISLAFTSQS